MALKDKFKQLQQGGGVPGSFQDIVTQASTVAAIEKQAEQPVQQSVKISGANPFTPESAAIKPSEVRYMRLPNPQIPIVEYNLVTRHCESFANMTRQDFVELAIIEKLHAEGLLSDDDFSARQTEIHSRPPRGQRKGMKNTMK